VSDLTALMRRVAAASQAYDESELLRLLRQLVPEFDRTAAESGAVISMQRVRR
jgi:hypothetical protein